MSVSKRIKLLRTSLQYTQEELANKVGMSRVYLGQLETEQVQPSEKLIRSIAHATGGNLNWLVSGDGPMFNENELSDPWKNEAFQTLKSANEFLRKENERVWALLEYFNPDLAKKMGKLLAPDYSPGLHIVGSNSGAKIAA